MSTSLLYHAFGVKGITYQATSYVGHWVVVSLLKPCFVLLDEMNLAKVEQYFSDFLSILWSRTSDCPEGETIRLHAFDTPRETVGGLAVPNRIRVPGNVLFTGTVNVDESTYMFSPKVLDRSNVIEFDEVELDPGESIAHERFALSDRHRMLAEIVTGLGNWRAPSIGDFEQAARTNPRFKLVLADLLALLKRYHLHFGYRVINEISRFLLHAETSLERYVFEDTFDIQMLQKILPKFHGTQAKLQEPLERLLAFCRADQSGYEDALIERALAGEADARFPRSARKIAAMLGNLHMQGYCSFIE